MSASTDITTPAALRRLRVDWTPYFMGAGIGVLSWIVFAVADDPLGVTSALSAIAGFAAMPFTCAEGVHALIGAVVIAGAIAFAFSFDWIKTTLLPIAAFGPVRLPDLTGIPDLAWLAALAAVAFAALYLLDRGHV
jgi:hypothetical protein